MTLAMPRPAKHKGPRKNRGRPPKPEDYGPTPEVLYHRLQLVPPSGPQAKTDPQDGETPLRRLYAFRFVLFGIGEADRTFPPSYVAAGERFERLHRHVMGTRRLRAQKLEGGTRPDPRPKAPPEPVDDDAAKLEVHAQESLEAILGALSATHRAIQDDIVNLCCYHRAPGVLSKGAVLWQSRDHAQVKRIMIGLGILERRGH